MTIHYALLVLLVAMLVTTITSLYDLTIQLFTRQLATIQESKKVCAKIITDLKFQMTP